MLVCRYEQAAESSQEAEEYFEKICLSIKKDDIDMWSAEIIAAETQRLQIPEAMDIMGVRQAAAASSIPDYLVQQPNEQGIEWITLALSVEERQ